MRVAWVTSGCVAVYGHQSAAETVLDDAVSRDRVAMDGHQSASETGSDGAEGDNVEYDVEYQVEVEVSHGGVYPILGENH